MYPTVYRQPNKQNKKDEGRCDAIRFDFTENEHGIGERAEDGEEQSSDKAGAEDLEQELAAIGEVGGGREHEVAIDDDEEQVAEDGGGARQEPVRLLAGGLGSEAGERVEAEVERLSLPEAVDPVGDQIGRQRVVGDEAAVGLGAAEDED